MILYSVNVMYRQNRSEEQNKRREGRDETTKEPSEKDKGEQRGGIGPYLPLFVTVRLVVVAVCQSSWELADYAIENKRLATT